MQKCIKKVKSSRVDVLKLLASGELNDYKIAAILKFVISCCDAVGEDC